MHFLVPATAQNAKRDCAHTLLTSKNRASPQKRSDAPNSCRHTEKKRASAADDSTIYRSLPNTDDVRRTPPAVASANVDDESGERNSRNIAINGRHDLCTCGRRAVVGNEKNKSTQTGNVRFTIINNTKQVQSFLGTATSMVHQRVSICTRAGKMKATATSNELRTFERAAETDNVVSPQPSSTELMSTHFFCSSRCCYCATNCRTHSKAFQRNTHQH